MKLFLTKILVFGNVLFLIIIVSGQLYNSKIKYILSESYWPVKRNTETKDTNLSQNYDLIVLGSSHAYRSINPVILDSILNINSYNLASSGQSIQTSFELLKWFFKTKKSNRFILEVYEHSLSSKYNFLESMHVYDGFQDSYLKNAIRRNLSFEEQINSFNLLYRLNNYKSLLKKSTPIKKQDINGRKENFYKGFVGSSQLKQFKYPDPNKFENEFSLNDDCIIMLGSIIDFCKQNNIELTLFTQPIHPTLEKGNARRKLYQFLREYSFKERIEYLSDEDNISKISNLDFYDSGHFFESGANKFTTFISKELRKKNAD